MIIINDKRYNKVTKRHLSDKDINFINHFDTKEEKIMMKFERQAQIVVEEMMEDMEINHELISFSSDEEKEGYKEMLLYEMMDEIIAEDHWLNPKGEYNKLHEKFGVLDMHTFRCKKCHIRVYGA